MEQSERPKDLTTSASMSTNSPTETCQENETKFPHVWSRMIRAGATTTLDLTIALHPINQILWAVCSIPHCCNGVDFCFVCGCSYRASPFDTARSYPGFVVAVVQFPTWWSISLCRCIVLCLASCGLLLSTLV
jgi:hypothetical protein